MSAKTGTLKQVVMGNAVGETKTFLVPYWALRDWQLLGADESGTLVVRFTHPNTGFLDAYLTACCGEVAISSGVEAVCLNCVKELDASYLTAPAPVVWTPTSVAL